MFVCLSFYYKTINYTFTVCPVFKCLNVGDFSLTEPEPGFQALIKEFDKTVRGLEKMLLFIYYFIFKQIISTSSSNSIMYNLLQKNVHILT